MKMLSNERRVGTSVGGSVAEWSKVLVLGTSHFDGVGSNSTAARFCLLRKVNASRFNLQFCKFILA